MDDFELFRNLEEFGIDPEEFSRMDEDEQWEVLDDAGLDPSCYQGERYLIQEENNKGWDYLSLWQITPRSTCLCRAFFDIIDGVAEGTVQELLSSPALKDLPSWKCSIMRNWRQEMQNVDRT